MEKTAKEMFDYRVNLLRHSCNFEKTQRVPIVANIFGWMFIDAGYTTLECTKDYEKAEKAGRRFIEKYPVDKLSHGGTGWCILPTKPYEYLSEEGASFGAAGGDENNINGIQESELIKADEYDEYISDTKKFAWEKAFFRAFPKAANFTAEEYVEAVRLFKEYFDVRNHCIDIVRNEYGLVDDVGIPSVSAGINNLLNYYRGIKGLSMDLRRQPNKVAEYCESVDKPALERVTKLFSENPGWDMNQPYDIRSSFMAHIVCNNKNFERFFMPIMSGLAKACADYDKQMFINAEADFLRFADFFDDFKKGTVSCIVEMDDPYEVRKRLPNIAIIGGLAVDAMGNSTPDKCVDMAKKAIDELGQDGGLWIAPNKFVSYPYDMKSENLSAVCDFVLNYRS